MPQWKPPKWPGRKFPKQTPRNTRPVDAGLLFLTTDVCNRVNELYRGQIRVYKDGMKTPIKLVEAQLICRDLGMNLGDVLDWRTFKPYGYSYYGSK